MVVWNKKMNKNLDFVPLKSSKPCVRLIQHYLWMSNLFQPIFSPFLAHFMMKNCFLKNLVSLHKNQKKCILMGQNIYSMLPKQNFDKSIMSSRCPSIFCPYFWPIAWRAPQRIGGSILRRMSHMKGTRIWLIDC